VQYRIWKSYPVLHTHFYLLLKVERHKQNERSRVLYRKRKEPVQRNITDFYTFNKVTPFTKKRYTLMTGQKMQNLCLSIFLIYLQQYSNVTNVTCSQSFTFSNFPYLQVLKFCCFITLSMPSFPVHFGVLYVTDYTVSSLPCIFVWCCSHLSAWWRRMQLFMIMQTCFGAGLTY
jgi:hypothetical protein